MLNGVPVEALWDSSAQVSIASKSWLGEYLPSLKPRNIEELPGEEAGLNLIGANGGPIPFNGWVEVQFQLTSRAQSSTPLTVPLQMPQCHIKSLGIMSSKKQLKVQTKREEEAQNPSERL